MVLAAAEQRHIRGKRQGDFKRGGDNKDECTKAETWAIFCNGKSQTWTGCSTYKLLNR